ncbi:MAG: hypothetical protein KDD99_24865 [Bacteroidetes bacterium]|nr:hypothetical protein [Bacteroidota bacterium]
MKKRIIFICILFSGLYAQAQQELSLHFSRIVQSQETNPAIFSEKALVVGLPALSLGYSNNAFAYGDLIQKDPNSDSTILNIAGVIDQMEDRNLLQTQFNVDYVKLVLTHKKWYASFQVSDKLDTRFGFSKGLVQLLWYGNAPFLGESLELTPTLNLTYYREISVGGGIRMENWQVGVRIKQLTGLAQASMPQAQFSLTTDANDYHLTLQADYLLQTSGIQAFIDDPLSAAASVENTGMAVDFGGLYRLNDQWTFQASLTNLGYINWDKDVRNFSVKGEYKFEGIEINEFLNDDSLYFEQLIDTLTQTFAPTESNQGYRSNLIPRYYLSASWQPMKNLKVGALLYGEWFDGWRPALALYAGQRILPFWEAGITYVAKNKTWANLGLQTSANLGPVQIYAVTDNVYSLIQMRNAKQVSVRVGVNVALWKVEN